MSSKYNLKYFHKDQIEQIIYETYLIILRLLFGCIRFAVSGSIFLKWLCNNSEDMDNIVAAGINDDWKKYNNKNIKQIKGITFSDS